MIYVDDTWSHLRSRLPVPTHLGVYHMSSTYIIYIFIVIYVKPRERHCINDILSRHIVDDLWYTPKCVGIGIVIYVYHLYALALSFTRIGGNVLFAYITPRESESVSMIYLGNIAMYICGFAGLFCTRALKKRHIFCKYSSIT